MVVQTLGYLQLFYFTKVHSVTGDNCKFAQVVLETAAHDHKFGHVQLLMKYT